MMKTKVVYSKSRKYELPQEQPFNPNVEVYFSHPPNTKYWVHGIQTDDVIDAKMEQRAVQVDKLLQIPAAVQRSPEWFAQRNEMITASLIPTVIGQNEYEPQYKSILQKITDIPFLGKKACFHGKKFEEIATSIYKYRMNVDIGTFGCITHKCGFIGASPDGIITKFKLDGIHRTNLVGRMLEVKCVDTRKINMTSSNPEDIVPSHYYPQPQIQMQCCDLDECDFWQCNIKEYRNREEFLDDTDANEPFRSRTTGLEKGVIIQLLPTEEINGKTNIDEIRYDHAKWIYPSKIELSPYECDQWIANICSTYRDNPCFAKYIIDKVIYWKLLEARAVTLKRDDEWFARNYPIIETIWKYILFLRQNETQKKLFIDYVAYVESENGITKTRRPNHEINEKINENVMKMMAILYNTHTKTYKHDLAKIRKSITPQTQNTQLNTPMDSDFANFMICS